jgi:hypothetical protein
MRRQASVIAGAMQVLLLVLSGCAGRDFVRPASSSLRLGQTTEAEIRERFGDPYAEGTTLKNGETLRTLSYGYASGAASLGGGLTPARSLGFYVWRDVLVGHEFVSSFPEDKTDFATSKAEQIRRGETTEAEVTLLMGSPHGLYAYPLVPGRDERGLVYLYAQTRGSGFNLKFYQQLLVVTVSAGGVVKDVQLTASGNR